MILNQLERLQRMREGKPLPPVWTLRLADPESRESDSPFPLRRPTFSLRDMAHQDVPCHFAEQNDARYVPHSKEFCIL
jgi:hypothetical protein